MGVKELIQFKGKKEINDQFKREDGNIHHALESYRKIKEANGTYQFGQLTARYWDYPKEEHDKWIRLVNDYYPQEVQDQITHFIVMALTNKDANGKDAPIPLKLEWPADQPKGVTCSFDPTGPSYTINISGYSAPLDTAERQKRKKTY